VDRLLSSGTRPRDSRRRIWLAPLPSRFPNGAGEQRNRRAPARNPEPQQRCREYRPMNSTSSSTSIVARQQAAATTHCSQLSMPGLAKITQMDDHSGHRRADAAEARRHPAEAAPMDVSRVERSDDQKIRQYECPSAGPCPPEPAAQLTDERSVHPCLAKKQRNRSRCVT
jgi:hypothetical protein